LLAALAVIGLVQGAARPATEPSTSRDRLTSRPRSAPPKAKAASPGDEIRTARGQRRRVLLPGGAVLYLNENTTVKLAAARRVVLAAGEVFVDAAPLGKAGTSPLVVQTPAEEVTGRASRFAVRSTAAGTGLLVTRGVAHVGRSRDAVRAGQERLPGRAKPTAAPRVSHRLDWTRELVAAAESPLAPASSHAGGALVAIDPAGQEAKLSLRRYHVDVHIEDGFARTTIDQTYFNHEDERLEGTFYFPLPADASLSRLAMYVDGHLMEGGMVERDYARSVYERILYQQRDPALLEWVDGSTFKMRVFPLEPRQEKRIILSYTQKLPSLYGQMQFRFPAGHSLSFVRDWSFHARVKHGAGRAWSSPSHTLQAAKESGDLRLTASAFNTHVDRDLVLRVAEDAQTDQPGEAVRFSSAEQEGSRYLMLRYRPQLPTSNRKSQIANRKLWLFLFESSGDRDPLLARAQVEVVRHLLGQAEPDDTFAVLAAGTRVRSFARRPRPVTPGKVQAAIAFLEKAHLVGALDLGRALAAARPLLRDAPEAYLVHVGSGIAAMGERRPDVLAKRIPAGARYVGVGVGRRWARGFMKAAAERSGGYFTQINPDEPVAWRAFELAATLNTPRLLGARVGDPDGRARFLTFTNTIAQGEELCAVARLGQKDALPESVTVAGTLDGKPFERALPVKDVAGKADYLPRTWAKLEIERLLAEDAVKYKDRIVTLSKAMYVMTPYTSLLVLENEDMYTQYKVDRGRQDHWAIYPLPKTIPVVRDAQRKGSRKKAAEVLATIVRQGRPRFLMEHSSDTRIPEEEEASSRSVREREKLHAQDAGGPGTYEDLRRARPRGGDRDSYLRDMPMRPQAPPPNQPSEGAPDIQEQSAELLADKNEAKSSPGLRSVWGSLPELKGIIKDQSVERTKAEMNRKDKGNGGIDNRDDLVEGQRAVRRRGRFAVKELESRTGKIERIMGFTRLRRNAVGNPKGEGKGDLSALLYQRPSFAGDDRFFFDLVNYAPGMATSLADIQAVLEAEAKPYRHAKPGQIDETARELFDKARVLGWHELTIPAGGSRPSFTMLFDGQGRYAYERTLPIGLREQVVCDGKTLWHLYPELGLGARRQVSRFHRANFAELVPWALPRPEDLARGADLRSINARTVALVPHGAAERKTRAGKPVPYRCIQFVFARDGRLAEQQVVRMPANEILYRETYAADGTIRIFGKDGKEIDVRKWALKPAAEPSLKPNTKHLVVLSLPYRTREHVLETLKIKNKPYQTLRFADALPLFAADVAAGNGSEALNVFKQAFYDRDQRQIGFYVLLASCGQNLDADHADVMAEHPDSPLAQYLALHSSPLLRKHASQWAVSSRQWAGAGFLKHLALSHALYQRWQNDKVLKGGAARRKTEIGRALDYIRANKGTVFGWGLLCLVQDRAGQDKALHRRLADLWPLFEDVPGLEYAARYERARSLWHAGEKEQARTAFRALYERTLKEGRLPRIDPDFRQALLSDADVWDGLVRRTAQRLIADKHRPAVLALAWQCWQLDDRPLANELLRTALDGIPDKKESLAMALAGIEFFWETSQFGRAERLLEKLLADPKLARRAALWRLASRLAERREMPSRALECLERALDAEYQDLPPVINLAAVREDYGKLLEHYERLADAMVTLRVKPPPDFLTRVVRAADRWRALDRGATTACQSAGRILRTLGDKDLSWDYLTTPVGLRPNEAEPWHELAVALSRKGDLELADRAFTAAFEAEPTNAQLLWDRAQNLREAGKTVEANRLLRQLAEGTWQPRFQGLQAQARWQVKGR
jgi:tetratricopeptide (TPR) repeat protein